MSDIPEIALSVRQPWAWAIIHGGKDIENRSWQAVNHGLNFRGSIAVHAAKGMTKAEYEDAAHFMGALNVDCPHPKNLIRGAIIGSVSVVGVVKEHTSPWFFGPRGIVLEDPQPCSPIGVSGALGYFNWTRREASETVDPLNWMLNYGEAMQDVLSAPVRDMFATPPPAKGE